MPLFTKSILSAPEKTDGLRISVMSRHTLSDGVTPDERITPDLFDVHYPMLGPSPKLVGDYYKRGLSWEDFAARFLEELRANPQAVALLKEIAHRAVVQNVTLLCIEETDEHCHRRLLVEECERFKS